MTPTETLRAMLDECGVEYEGGERSLRWRDRYGIMMQAFPLANGELGMGVWSCTPEQAIAATLGASDATDARQGDADLAAENAKLRELLDYITPIAWYASSERERDRMRELGVEVES